MVTQPEYRTATRRSDQSARAPAQKISIALPWFLTTRSKPQGESGWSGTRSRRRSERERVANLHQQWERGRTKLTCSRLKDWQADLTQMPGRFPVR